MSDYFIAKPNYNIVFSREGERIGELDFNGPEMKFTGNAEESAKVFFDFIAKSFSQRLQDERPSGPPHRNAVLVPRALLNETIDALYRKDNMDSHKLARELERLAAAEPGALRRPDEVKREVDETNPVRLS